MKYHYRIGYIVSNIIIGKDSLYTNKLNYEKIKGLTDGYW